MKREDRIGDCHVCPATGVVIPYGWKTLRQHCSICNRDRLRAKDRDKKASRPPRKRKVFQKASYKRIPRVSKSYLSDQARDATTNKEIWESRPHECFECLKHLSGKPIKGWFSHVHSKGARPDLRFEKANIVLHCHPGGCHQKWETGDRSQMPKTLQLFHELSERFPDNKLGRQSVDKPD